jgi:C4-dicarboxylate transporter DctM subunit
MELGLATQFCLILAVASVVILSGVPIAYGLGLLCIGITFVMVGSERLPLLGSVSYGEAVHPALLAIPLFLLTAELLAGANISDRTFEVLARRFRKFPAGLAVVTTMLSTIFSAILGSSAGNTALMGRVALRPMLARKYDKSLTAGVIVAGGALGALIPPSTLFILYGVVTEMSVFDLMVAGLAPGLLMAFLMIVYVIVYAKISPRMSGVESVDGIEMERVALLTRRRLAFQDMGALLPVAALVVFLSVSMYRGIATATEIAAFGTFGAIVIVMGYRRFSAKGFWGALLNTSRTTSMLLLLVVMASYLGRLFAYLGVGPALVDTVGGLGWPPLAVVALLCLFLFIMGTVFDSAAIILVIGPLAHQLVVSLGLDPIWWGVVFVISMEIALITPPFGINLFILKGMSKALTMRDINRGAWQFTAVHTVGLIICVLSPSFVLWLPSRM